MGLQKQGNEDMIGDEIPLKHVPSLLPFAQRALPREINLLQHQTGQAGRTRGQGRMARAI